MRERAEAAAAYLELPLEVRVTGYGSLETRLTTLVEQGREGGEG